MTAATPRRHPGQTRITAHALHRATAAAAAEALGVPSRLVHVSLSDRGGDLVAEVAGPVASVPLDQAEPGSSGVGVSDTSLLDRLTDARVGLVDRVRSVTGSRIGALDLRVTGVRLSTEGRVR